MLDLDPLARSVFAAVYVAVQLGLIATSGQKSDNAFGFRMFNQSSTLEAHLMREVEAPSGHGTTLVPVEGGVWSAHDEEGNLRRFAWADRVKQINLRVFDQTLHAQYGVEAQMARWQAALDDVSTHILHDHDTVRLVLDVTTRRNAHDPQTTRLTPQ